VKRHGEIESGQIDNCSNYVHGINCKHSKTVRRSRGGRAEGESGKGLCMWIPLVDVTGEGKNRSQLKEHLPGEWTKETRVSSLSPSFYQHEG
jgi:hypothetical protein